MADRQEMIDSIVQRVRDFERRLHHLKGSCTDAAQAEASRRWVDEESRAIIVGMHRFLEARPEDARIFRESWRVCANGIERVRESFSLDRTGVGI